ncbi:APC family permease [Microbacterium sp. PMB16]|uniref:APC family permease n=1 Tax=Microbacterium sp. PMB16 TaxID=3120157 RepID=UPI003F4BC977
MAETTNARTRSGLGLLQGVALYVASVLGTGLLVLPGLASATAGPASLVAVVAVTLLAIPLASAFAALASRYPDAGGVASYARRALGAAAARATGYWFFFGVAAGGPVVATLGAQYLSTILGVDRALIPVVAVAFFGVSFGVNLFGVRVAGWLQLLLTALLLGVVVTVVAVSAPAVHPANFTPFLPHGWAGVGTAVVMFVWAFSGWEVGTHISGEFAEPRRVIPLATAITLLISSGAYVALQIVTVGALGSAAGDGGVVLLDLAERGAPGVAPILVGTVAAIVAVGVLNVYLAAFAKLGASLALNGDLPRWFARGAEDGQVPRRSLLLTGGIGAIYFVALLVTDLDLQPFILVHTASMVAIYAVGMIAALRILARGSAGWWMALIAAALSVGLLALAGLSLVVPALLGAAAALIAAAQKVMKRFFTKN